MSTVSQDAYTTQFAGERPKINIQLSGEILVVTSSNRPGRNRGRFDERERECMVGLSASASKRMARYLRSSLAVYKVFITLTYPYGFPLDGRICKEHLRRFNQEVARFLRLRNYLPHEISLFWFLEFQSRGAPHFHIFCTHFIDKDWLSRTWFRIVGSDDDRHLKAGTNVQAFMEGRSGACAYARKYARKEEQKDVPEKFLNVGRFWGITGQRNVVVAATQIDPEYFIFADYREQKSRLLARIEREINAGNLIILKKGEGFRVMKCLKTSCQWRINIEIGLFNQYIEVKYGPLGGRMLPQGLFKGAELEVVT